jgi:hypothetical protein
MNGNLHPAASANNAKVMPAGYCRNGRETARLRGISSGFADRLARRPAIADTLVPFDPS